MIATRRRHPRTLNRPSAADLAAATPADRDRYLDLLRAMALSIVVLGHWLIAVVWMDQAQLRADNLLVLAPWSRGLTWILQVMPLFFLVGGVVNARSWRSAHTGASGYATWMRGRSARLLRPAVPLLWLWFGVAAVASAAGLAPATITLGAIASLIPLWFLAVYLMVVALTPVMLALHDRWGLAAPAAMALAALAVDALHYAGGVSIGPANFLFVWGAAHQLGFCWGDGLLNRQAARWWLVGGGLAALVLLVTQLGYPVSMVGVDGAARSNNYPPSAALVALAAAQAGAALIARAPAERLLARPGAWRAVIRLNLMAMTMYLWHLTAMVAVVGLAWLAGWLPDIDPLSPAWWWSRPVWLAVLILATAPLVALLAPIEWSTPKPAPWRPGAGTGAVAAAAVAMAAAGVARLVTGGIDGGQALPIPAAIVIAITGSAAILGAFRLPGRGGARRCVIGPPAEEAPAIR